MRAGDVFPINVLFILGIRASVFSVCRCDRGLGTRPPSAAGGLLFSWEEASFARDPWMPERGD